MSEEKLGTVAPIPRIHAILARQAPVGVVLRRGPSKWVELIRWDRVTDQFTRGAWFHGRIYERRCDLSPHGELFVYFAQKLGGPQDASYTYAWTAVSKPPWLTALGLWPKGNCWDGGGLFTTDHDLWVNHSTDGALAHPDHQPTGLRVTSDDRGRGEDYPIYGLRLERDGWLPIARGRTELLGSKGYRTLEPAIWEKPGKSTRWTLILRNSLTGWRQRYEYEVRSEQHTQPLPGAVWADWDDDRGLTYSANGRLYRVNPSDAGLGPPIELADFVPDKPEARTPPEWATRW